MPSLSARRDSMKGTTMYRNPAIAAELAAKYADQFATLQACIQLGDEYMAATTKRTLDTASEAVLNTIFTRMYNNLCAATILLEDGYGVEAGMLTRALLEGFFNVCYIVNFRGCTIANKREYDADTLAQRFINFQHADHFFAVENAKEAGATLHDDEYEKAERERQEYWDKEYGWGKRPPLDWSGLGWRQKARYGGVEEVYVWLHRHFSEMVHGGPAAYRQLIQEDDAGTGYYPGPQDILIDVPIPALGLLFSLAVQLIAEHIELPVMAERAGQVHDAVKHTFGIEVEDVP